MWGRRLRRPTLWVEAEGGDGVADRAVELRGDPEQRPDDRDPDRQQGQDVLDHGLPLLAAEAVLAVRRPAGQSHVHTQHLLVRSLSFLLWSLRRPFPRSSDTSLANAALPDTGHSVGNPPFKCR